MQHDKENSNVKTILLLGLIFFIGYFILIWYANRPVKNENSISYAKYEIENIDNRYFFVDSSGKHYFWFNDSAYIKPYSGTYNLAYTGDTPTFRDGVWSVTEPPATKVNATATHLEVLVKKESF